jgi:hypothetical protein
MINKTIKRFVEGPTSSGLMTWYAAELECGHRWFQNGSHWNPITGKAVGDTVECERCNINAAEEQWLRAMDYRQVHHSRFDPRFGEHRDGRYHGTYHFYKLDVTSPSGFMLINSVAATPAIDAILKTKTNCCPLSPTERA